MIDAAGDSLYGQMARLGLAEAQARERASTTRRSTPTRSWPQRKDGPLPVDGILMRLGRTYLDAGKTTEAQQTFNRMVAGIPGVAVQRRRPPRARVAEEVA